MLRPTSFPKRRGVRVMPLCFFDVVVLNGCMDAALPEL
jgi:hypothetical protein